MVLLADAKQNIQKEKIKEEDEEEEIKTWEELGLDPRLISALNKNGIDKPTPIQISGIPLILDGKDVVARAKTGSGKTYAYLLPLLQKLFSDTGASKKTAPSAMILVPTRELCQQVYEEVLSLIAACKVQLKVVQVTSSMAGKDSRAALAGPPDILVSTPACISTCLQSDALKTNSIQESLQLLVLDEADLLLSYGYEDDLKALTPHIPRRCQCLLMSATSSADVEKLKKLVLHSPVILTLSEVGDVKDEMIPKNVQQFWISCSTRDKQLYMLSLLKLELVQKKILIFVNTIDMGFRLKLFLEQFGIKTAVLNAELPQNSRLHILEEFNAGLFDYLIATDDSQMKEKEKANDDAQVTSKKSKRHPKPKLDSEFGVVRGIDFKNVYTVINFEMPLNAAGYVHRIGPTGRAYNTGASVSLVSEDEMKVFKEIQGTLGEEEEEDSKGGSNFIAPFPLLTKNAVESLRYRAEEALKRLEVNLDKRIEGTTCIGLVNNGEIKMAADGYGFIKKTFVLFNGVKRRTDWEDDKSSYFDVGDNPVYGYYDSHLETLNSAYPLTKDEKINISSSWEERGQFVVAEDSSQKVFVLGLPCRIILTMCGFYYIFRKLVDKLEEWGEHLKKTGNTVTFYQCVVECHEFLKDFKPESSDHKGRNLEEISCTILIGGFEETGMEDKRVPKIYKVDKHRIELMKEPYVCLGQGHFLAEKILKDKFENDVAENDAIKYLFEGIQAASLARMSGGQILIVSLPEDGDYYIELQEKIGM